jgi:hypothetical protein
MALVRHVVANRLGLLSGGKPDIEQTSPNDQVWTPQAVIRGHSLDVPIGLSH